MSGNQALMLGLLSFTLLLVPFSLNFYVSATDLPPKDLKQVHIVFRHGDRAPLKRYKNDGIIEAHWPEPQGTGALTALGIAEQYALGKWLRKRYEGFLTAGMERKEVYIRASSHSRTLESAGALAAGFFPPIANLTSWHNEETNSSHASTPATTGSMPHTNHTHNHTDTLGSLWRPMPIHSAVKGQDTLFQQTNCPKIDQLNVDLYRLADQKFHDRMDLENLLLKNAEDAGRTVWDRVTAVSDSLECLKKHHLSLPKWATVDAKAMLQLKTMADWLISRYTGYSPDEEVRESFERSRLTGGPLLKQIMDSLCNSSESTKMFLYTGHDSTVGALHAIFHMISSSGPKSALQTPFNAAVIVELFKNDSMRLLYRDKFLENHTELEMEVVPLPCSTLSSTCPLEHLKHLTDRWTNIGAWDTECFVPADVASYPSGGTWAIVIVLALLVLLIFGVRWYRQRKAATKPPSPHENGHPDPVVSYKTLDNHGF